MPPCLNILLVDDDQNFAAAMAMSLRNVGHTVSVASHFNEALAILESGECPDVMVTDIVMPESVNGVALGRMARLRCNDLRVVYMTGYEIPGVEETVVGPVLRKPIDLEQLNQSIVNAMSRPPKR